MEQIITITTGGQGSPVVSARELYTFLGFDSSQWARWSKKNIVNNRFAKEGEDWERLDIMSNGNPTTDYALTLDFAKRLSMLARTEKGEEVRRYFISKEEELRQLATAPAPLTTEQLLVQLLTNQQQQLEQLRADVESIRHTSHKPGPVRLPGKQLGLPGMPPPGPRAASLRQQITHRVNDYCQMIGATSHETWTYLYKRLYDVYGISAYRLAKRPGESMLDSLERYGHLDRLDNLIRAELDYRDE